MNEKIKEKFMLYASKLKNGEILVFDEQLKLVNKLKGTPTSSGERSDLLQLPPQGLS